MSKKGHIKPFFTSAAFMSKDLSYGFLLTVISLLILQGLGEKKIIHFPLSSWVYLQRFQICMATSGLKAEFDAEEWF